VILVDKAMDNIILGSHELKINDRREIFLTGIKKITSFDSEEFLMESNMGVILLKGKNLEIIKLDTHDGNVKIKGKINSFNYLDQDIKENKESFFSKLFK
jgi:sporulation protein YabP